MSEDAERRSENDTPFSESWRSLFGAHTSGNPLEQLLKLWSMTGVPGGLDLDVGALLKAWTAGPGSAAPFSQWLTDSLTEILNDGAPAEGLSAFLSGPLQLWRSQLAKLGGDYGGLWASLPPPATWFGMSELPPLGLNREWEAKLRAWRHSAKRAFEAHNALERHYAQIYRAAIARLRDSVNKPAADAPQISTLRELYDLWIDVAEESYQAHVMTEPYAKAFGTFINETAQAQQTWHVLYDDIQATLNLPNRREIDAVLAQQTALANELNARDKRPGIITSLQREVALLRSQVEELKAGARTERVTAGVTADAAPLKPQPKTKVASKPRRPAKSRSNGMKRNAKQPARAAAEAAQEFDIGNFD